MKLPTLPEKAIQLPYGEIHVEIANGRAMPFFTEEQLHAYGKACAETMREECAAVIERGMYPHPIGEYTVQYNATVKHDAAAIRALEIEYASNK
jgi:hypothetical protein